MPNDLGIARVCVRTAKSLWCLIIASTPGWQTASGSLGEGE